MYGGIPATASGRTLELEATDDLAWSLAHWAVANAKEFAVTRVQVDGQSWDRQARNGWQASDASDGKVIITLAEAPA